jgi:hypothetical protein
LDDIRNNLISNLQTRGLSSSASLPLPTGGFVTQGTSSVTGLSTVVNQAVDGDEDTIPLDGTTTSNFIRFLVTGSSSASSPIVGFVCTLDGARLSSDICPASGLNGAQVNTNIPQNGGLIPVPIRSDCNSAISCRHVFTVSAVNSAGDIDNVGAVFRWRITGNAIAPTVPGITSSATEVGRQVSQSSLDTLQENRNLVQATQNQAVQALGDLAQATLTATQQANNLNPPMAECDTKNSDLAIYKVEGKTDLRKLLRSDSSQSIPVNLELFVDAQPTDSANQIVGHNNRIITGKLISNPGNTQLQRDVDLELKRITTECKSTAIISQHEIIKAPSKHPARPAIIPVHGQAQTTNLDPPFSTCFSDTDAKQTAQPPKITKAIEQAQNQPQTNPKASAILSLPAGATTSDQLLSAQAIRTPSLATTPGLTASAAINKEGSTFPVDIAKYVVRGVINKNQFSGVKNDQDIIFTMIVDLNPLTPPQDKPSSVSDTSDLVAANIQVNPGSRTSWQVGGFLVNEIYTVCSLVPFVSKPLAIGDDPGDFGTQVVSDLAGKSK